MGELTTGREEFGGIPRKRPNTKLVGFFYISVQANFVAMSKSLD